MNEPEPLSALRRACTALAPIPDEEWGVLAARIGAWSVPRGGWLLRQGEPVEWLGFLARGLVRLSHQVGEREVTLGFDCEGRFIGAYDAYVRRAPSGLSLEALEPCVALRFPRALLEEFETRHACWRQLARRIAEHELVRRMDKELRIRTRTPEERYAELVRRGSYLVRRVPQYHLASFLGVAPETLSRIRSRLTASSRAPARS